MTLKELRHATLAAHHSAAIAAKDAALETGRDDLYEAVCELVMLLKEEIKRRQDACETQGELNALSAALRGVSIAEIEQEMGHEIRTK